MSKNNELPLEVTGYLSLRVQEATTSPPSVLAVSVSSQNTNPPLPYSKPGATNPRPLNPSPPRGCTEWWVVGPAHFGGRLPGWGQGLEVLTPRLSGCLSGFLLLYTVHSTLGPSSCAPLAPGACPPFPSHTLPRQPHPELGAGRVSGNDSSVGTPRVPKGIVRGQGTCCLP